MRRRPCFLPRYPSRCKASRRRRSRVLSSLSSALLFKISTNVLWSTTRSKCGRPFRNCRHILIAQAAPKLFHTSSIMAYQVSAADRNRYPAWVIFHCLSSACERIRGHGDGIHPRAGRWDMPNRRMLVH